MKEHDHIRIRYKDTEVAIFGRAAIAIVVAAAGTVVTIVGAIFLLRSLLGL